MTNQRLSFKANTDWSLVFPANILEIGHMSTVSHSIFNYSRTDWTPPSLSWLNYVHWVGVYAVTEWKDTHRCFLYDERKAGLMGKEQQMLQTSIASRIGMFAGHIIIV